MIRSKFKLLLLVWPIVLLVGIFCYFSYERGQIDKKLFKADGMVWGTEEKQFKILVFEQEDGELLHIQIKIIGPDTREVYKAKETIDRDMFSGGFVRAAQVDDDPEKEIVVWHAQAKYYLDFVQGNVKKISFDQVTHEIKALAQRWHRYNVMAGLEMTISILFVFFYYFLYILVKIILKFFKKKSGV
jgi:hypothetical protein